MQLIDSYSEANQNTFAFIRDVHPTALALYSAIGQSFTVNIGGCKLVSAVFNMNRSKTPGILNAVLYAHSGVYGTSSLPTGNPLAVSDDFYASTIQALEPNYMLVTFTFSGAQQIELQKGEKYIIALQATSGIWSDPLLCMVRVGACDIPGTRHSGNACAYRAGVWLALAADWCFYVYGEPITSVKVAEGTEMPSTTSAPVTDCGGTRVRAIRHLSTLTPWIS